MLRCLWFCSPSQSKVTTSSSLFQAFASAVDTLFPYVTLVLTEQSWPPVLPAAVTGLSQRVALHLNTASLPEEQEALNSLTEMMDRYDLVVEADALPVFRGRLRQLTVRANTHLYMTVWSNLTEDGYDRQNYSSQKGCFCPTPSSLFDVTTCPVQWAHSLCNVQNI